MDISVEPNDADLQPYIDRLAAVGGGTLLLQAGRHVSGPIRLRSGITLSLDTGSTLEFVPDYQLYARNSVSVIAEGSDRAYIVAQDVDNIAILGKGKIVGSASAFNTGFDETVGTYTPNEKRPRVIVLEDCSNIRLEGVTIEESPMWTVHLVRCNDVIITGIKVLNNRQLPNTDGVVIDSCVDVAVSKVVISTADDGICLKTSRSEKGTGRCENVDVSDCLVESNSCALKIGTESFGDIRNVRFMRSKVQESNRALGIFSRDGGTIENVVFSDIEMDCHETVDGFWGSGEPLTITQLDRRPEVPAGVVRNVSVENLKGRSHGPINFFAERSGGIAGITLRNVQLTIQEGPLGTARQYDLRPTNADLSPPKGIEGRGNAWLRGTDGRIIGLVDYPGGMPAVFAHNTSDLILEGLDVVRPAPLPKGWNSMALCIND
ncbi:polygalacturonase [Rhizobium sp. R72]|uniref:polygalacturonase PglB n=1 Tax=unclassified Rhizobium TaxID=2613769 RepID=UPI000B53121D|nr:MULTISPECIES: glycosyl hydrolase family 28 protein [unclassified Rhizobium]OWV97334.1 polygalacturonase [Rhizobium sp. R72]OWV97673.1 polygalacturonase [Rhizobium sp. R711]